MNEDSKATGTDTPTKPTGLAVKTSMPPAAKPAMPKEIGGPKGPEPTRYGDWEQKGRCTDF